MWRQIWLRSGGLVLNQQSGLSHLPGRAFEHWLEIQIPVGDVYCQNALTLQMAKVESCRLQREQVHRDGIARKSIHHQNVKLLIGFLSRDRRASPNFTSTLAGLWVRYVNWLRASLTTCGLIS